MLIPVFSATLLAQTSRDIDAHQFPSSNLDDIASDSAEFPQQDSSQNDTNCSSSCQQNDWVHAWMRKVDKARASQPHYVSPIVTTHVLLV
jgi:hypothetical protein